MIAIIDYNAGNLQNVYNALTYIGAECKITSDRAEIQKADKIILPGVGAFAYAYKSLTSGGIADTVKEQISKGVPFLGICLGLQLLFEHSAEGDSPGLSVLKGTVERFSNNVIVPHIGWNSIEIKKDNPLLRGIDDGSYFYFVHSYYVIPENKDVISTTTPYDGGFCSMISKDNMFATQFHPEKSQKKGLQFFKNFVNL